MADDQFAERMGPWWTRALGLYHAVLGLAILYFLFAVWPAHLGSDREETIEPIRLLWGWLRFQVDMTEERQLLWLVALSGALGSYVHAATSFVNFTGSRSLVASWRWWYALRPLIGMGLALGFYFAVRAGFFAANSSTEDLNLIGFVATGFMVGMFSKQATQKLGELFDVLFHVTTPQKPEKDKMNEQPPKRSDSENADTSKTESTDTSRSENTDIPKT